MINDEKFPGAILRFQFQAKLLLNRGEHRSLALLWCPLQREIIVADESGLIRNNAAAAAQFPRQLPHQERDWNPLTSELAPPEAHHARSCGCAVGAFDSVRVSVARFCLLKFRTVLRDHQLIHWKVLGFAVE